MKFKLGKLPKRIDNRTFKLTKYFKALPPIPSAIDWTGKVSEWGMMLNDTLGCCTCSSAGHCDMLWTSNATTEIIPPDSSILTAYEAVGGYDPNNTQNPNPTDNGADVLTVLNYWRNTGIAGRKISAFAEINISNINELKTAIAFFGAAYIGVQLPQSAMDANEAGQEWTNTTDTNIDGGHAIPLVAYDQNGLTCITWGQKQTMTWQWLQTYMDEAYVVFSPDWIGSNGTAPSGFNVSQLTSDLTEL